MIQINELEKRYKGFNLKLSMEVPDGCITGLIGKNGAGKSTVIKSILGLIRMDGGEILLDGKDIRKLEAEEKQNLGVALAESGFSEYLSVKDVKRVLKAMYVNFDEQAFEDSCRRFGLDEKKLIKDYSTGMRAKLRVISALTHRAKLLILDEPTAGLDVEARCEILDYLRSYLTEDDSRSILITSHISTDLEGLCDDVYLIHNGAILLHEDTDRILSDYAILKMNEETNRRMHEQQEERYFLHEKKSSFGYECLTAEKQYFKDNYPELIIERAGIDDLIMLLTTGNK